MSAKKAGWLRERLNYFVFRALYIILWLHFRVRAFSQLLTHGRRKPKIAGTLPRHIAISGSIGNNIDDVAVLTKLAVSRGTEHVTLYDPWTSLDVNKIAQHLCLDGGKDQLWTVREIGEDGTFGEELRVHHDVVEVDRITEETTSAEFLAKITVVRPGAGRSSLVRAVRVLAENGGRGRAELSVAEVTEWLDGNAEGMLPSEPDCVVVFPAEDASERANVLHGFPVWQLRLTQIRFASKPIHSLDSHSFLQMVANATTVPKRFGR